MKKLFFCIVTAASISAILSFSSAFGASTLNYKIQGNPIGRRDDYTINSAQARKVSLNCVFSNTGARRANLNIWTSPAQTKPAKIIHLKDSTNNKTYSIKKDFTLQLNKNWWCQLYSQSPKNQWQYCAYFSVSDATIAKTYPFATWDKTIHSKGTHYKCEIVSTPDGVNIFYFKH